MLVLTAAIALAGCGSAGTDGTRAGVADDGSSTTTVTDPTPVAPQAGAEGASGGTAATPCGLLVAIDVPGLLAEEPAEPEGSPTTCTVRASDESSHARLDLTYRERGGAAAYQQVNQLLGIDAPVDGLGDEAFRTGSRIHARAGDRFFAIQVVRDATTAPQLDGAELVPIAFAVADEAGW